MKDFINNENRKITTSISVQCPIPKNKPHKIYKSIISCHYENQYLSSIGLYCLAAVMLVNVLFILF